MIKKLFLPVLIILVLSNCSDDSNDKTPNGKCLADALTLTETDVDDLAPSSYKAIISFDVKNTSNQDFDMANGSSAVSLKIEVTTTDDSKYETIVQLPVATISAGATTSTQVLVDYGEGKFFESYSITKKYCR